jgi:hypothetical protein
MSGVTSNNDKNLITVGICDFIKRANKCYDPATLVESVEVKKVEKFEAI